MTRGACASGVAEPPFYDRSMPSLSHRFANMPILIVVILMALSFAACRETGSGSATSTPGAGTAGATTNGPDRDGDGVPDASDRCDGPKEDSRWSDGTDG